MSRRSVFSLLLILFGVLLACGLLEGAVRVLGMDPPRGEPAFFWQDDERFGWFHAPGAEGWYFNPAGEYNAYARVNAAGLIDKDYPETKPDGVYRILVLGDSFTEGLRIPMDAAFHSVVERELRPESGKKVEVINGGVAGWGTDQQLLFYREVGRNYRPDLVLVAFFPANDVMNNTISLESENFGGVRKPYFLLEDGELVLHNYPVGSESQPERSSDSPAEEPEPAPTPAPPLEFTRPALGHSALYRYLVPRLRVAAPGLALKLARWGLIPRGSETSNAAQGPDYIPIAYGVYHDPLTPEWESGWQTTAAILAELKKQVEQDGARLAVVILPAQEQVVPGVWEMTLRRFPAMQSASWDLEQPNRRLAEILHDLGVPALDLLPVFRAADGASLFFPIDRHWNEQGHELAGEALVEWLGGE
ncbi:MAG TPA: hypothetical protein G4N94_04035 [Caldilineae bacterium]|nr:hypothetical protein [Caldilineae bacterium]